ncbi:MAG: tetratricopeptide repeat protein [Cytophagaceae bacterium]
MLKKAFIVLFAFLIHFSSFSQNTLYNTSENRLFREAIELIDKDNYTAAREYLERFINENPTGLMSADARYYMAYCALNLQNPDAEGLYLSFIQNYSYHTKIPVAYFDLGTHYYSKEKYDKAIQYFEKSNTEGLNRDQQIEMNFKLGYSYFSQKDFEKAGPLFTRVKSGKNRYSYAASYYSGFVEFKNGNFDESLSDFRRAEENDQYKPLVPYMIVNIFYKKGEMDELISYAGKILKSDQKIQNPDEFYLLTGEGYFRKGEYKDAELSLKKYMEEVKGKFTPEVQYRLAYSQFKNKNYKDAINNFKPIAANKDSIGQASSYYLGLSYVHTGNKEFALAAFDQSRRASFNKEIYMEALFNYGKITYDLERYNEAIPALKDYIKFFPGSPHYVEASELLSEAFFKSSNYSEALAYLETLPAKTMKVNIAYQKIAFMRGTELFNNGRYNEALDVFNKSLKYPLDKEFTVLAHFWKGESYSVLKQYNEAINSYASVFQSANESNSNFLKARYGIGYAYYNTKQFDKALPHFRNYVEKTEAERKLNYEDALLRLADLYYVSKNYELALQTYEKAINQKNPELEYAYFQKGLVLVKKGMIPEAKNIFEQVIQRYSSSLWYDDALFQLAQLNLQTGNWQAAVSGYTELIGIKPGSPFMPYAYLKRATAYFNQQKYDLAVNDYKFLLEKFINHPISNDAIIGVQEALASADRAEEFPEILSRYKDANPSSKELVNIEYENAKSLFNNQKYKQAIQSFLAYKNNYPNSPNNNDVIYYLGECYYRLNEYENALPYFRTLAQEKASVFYARAIQRIADLAYASGNYESAVLNYHILLNNSKNKKERSIAWIGLIESYYKAGKYDSVEYYSNNILQHGNATPNAESKAYLYLGKVAMDKGDTEKATDQFLQTINNAKDENAAEAQYLIAFMQYKDKKHKQSIESLHELNNTYPMYENWYGRSFLLIADNFIAMNETFQAKATLNSIIEKSKVAELVEKAKQKLEELDRKEETTNE